MEYGEDLPQQQNPELQLQPYQQLNNQNNQIASDLISQIDPSPIVDMVEHTLRGEVFDKNDLVYKKKFKPYMNEEGINKVIAQLRPIATINTTIGTLTEDKVARMIVEFNDEMSSELALKWHEFGMEKAFLSPVNNMIVRMAFFSINRAFEGGDKSLLKDTTVRHEQVLVNRPQEKKSMWHKLNPFGE